MRKNTCGEYENDDNNEEDDENEENTRQQQEYDWRSEIANAYDEEEEAHEYPEYLLNIPMRVHVPSDEVYKNTVRMLCDNERSDIMRVWEDVREHCSIFTIHARSLVAVNEHVEVYAAFDIIQHDEHRATKYELIHTTREHPDVVRKIVDDIAHALCGLLGTDRVETIPTAMDDIIESIHTHIICNNKLCDVMALPYCRVYDLVLGMPRYIQQMFCMRNADICTRCFELMRAARTRMDNTLTLEALRDLENVEEEEVAENDLENENTPCIAAPTHTVTANVILLSNADMVDVRHCLSKLDNLRLYSKDSNRDILISFSIRVPVFIDSEVAVTYGSACRACMYYIRCALNKNNIVVDCHMVHGVCNNYIEVF